jgi:MOSC domain
MQGTWLDPAAYDDRDLARTLVNLDAFFSQAGSADGRGLDVVDPPVEVVHQVRNALLEIGEATSGTFAELCTRLSASTTNKNWRTVADEVLRVAFVAHVENTQERRAQRQSALHGTVVGLHISNGGVPKKPVDRARISLNGIEGDRQATRLHHGRPWQALCLWSLETIDVIRGEGHPIAPGAAGENITLAGIDWREAVSGSTLQINDMVAELTLCSLPCSKNAQWFIDGNFNRIHHGVATGVSRMYAAVLTPGVVEVGDTATLHLR